MLPIAAQDATNSSLSARQVSEAGTYKDRRRKGMRKISIEGGPAVMLVCCATSSLTQAPFKRAEVSSAPGIRNPVESFADGVVVPDVSLDDRGAITGNSVVRDNHFLNSAATSETPAGI